MVTRCILLAALIGASMARAAEPARAKAAEFDPALPPQVVATEPADRATDVPATLREIKVTFDRPMTTGQNYSWIIHQNLGVYPGYRGAPPPRWENGGRTCVLPVLLSPGALYAVGTNSYRHTGFRDRKGKVAVPHVIVFKTKTAQEL